jgi:hypothetical protein
MKAVAVLDLQIQGTSDVFVIPELRSAENRNPGLNPYDVLDSRFRGNDGLRGK